MAKTGFDLASVLGDVPNLGTSADREQIEYIDIDRIDDDPNNFYELSGLDELAANIELCGLQQPIRVRAVEGGRFVIVSGHRRRAAVRKLVEDGRDDLRELPCIRERETGSPAMQELRLIYANSDTRRMTSAEIGRQAERVEALLYQLKEEGVEFPGRMRDYVAEACDISKSKLARLKVIRDGLTPYFRKLYDEGKLSESVAYEVARMPQEHAAFIEAHQDVLSVAVLGWTATTAATYARRLAAADEVICGDGKACSNRRNKYSASLKRGPWHPDDVCAKCCGKCDRLLRCKFACPGLAGKIKKLEAEQKEQQAQERAAARELELPIIRSLQQFWRRFGEARTAAGRSINECLAAVELLASRVGGIDGIEALERGELEPELAHPLPFGSSFYRRDAVQLVALADLLGCSLDYLLCRTDNPKGIDAAPAADTTEGAARSGAAWHPTSVEPEIGQAVIVVDATGYAEDARYIRSGVLSGGGMRWDEVTLWTPFPT